MAALVITFVAQSHTVQGASMEGTLYDGQRLLVEKVSYRFTEPHRGDIIVFRSPLNPSERMIKRVIGVPGDTVEIRQRVVYVNGVPLDEPYIKGPTYGDMHPVAVMPGHVFVLGDNRNQSLDSRSPAVGQIPYEAIIGRAVVVFWPPTAAKLLTAPAAFR